MKRVRDQVAQRPLQGQAVVPGPPTPILELPPAPALIPAFFHKSPLQLYDVTAPIPVHATKAEAAWTPFSREDSNALEALFAQVQKSTDADIVEEEAEEQPAPDTVLVGFERLHQVCLHTWQMTPVYWHARNAHQSQATVTRGTWFYASTWQPLPHALANLIEAGYQDVAPWTETYAAELAAATALGESATAKLKHPVDEGRYVTYQNAQRAWLGSSTLTARLTGKVMATLGRARKSALVEVCRGYDFSASQIDTPPPQAAASDALDKDQAVANDVTDLILVVHGIGQKLAETSEGWTFTHAVNRLRVNLHAQLATPVVKQHVRPAFRVQVLPVNWRIHLDLDAPPPAEAEENAFFTLEDITIDGIPAVRSLIGQVVLDIPYYMSHHKASMVDATIREANRVYALWIKHNPLFLKTGRVHLVAHSLGSAISFDILSKQPTDVATGPSLSTRLGRALNMRALEEEERAGQFAFNTTNVFCAGSPAAFFLLLHRRHLMPRRRLQVDKERPEATDTKITGRQGTYGSLACTNLYNLFYSTDPISYRMTATIDAALAQSLPPTHLPSTSAPYFSSFFNSSEKVETPPASRPKMPQLPTTVELPQHDFGRERIADARLALLNENKQIDYLLPASGGLLEGSSQYLSMMTAHQAYWDSAEFARVLVLECGREPGAQHTLPMMRGKKRVVVPEARKQHIK